MFNGKIFGIGLNRTGTKTLGAAFDALGYNHAGYSLQCLRAYRKGDFQTIDAHIAACDAFQDLPYGLFFKQLYDRYPDARFILTTRKSPEIWLESLKKHAFRCRPIIGNGHKLTYGYYFPFGREDEYIRLYQRHIEAVQTFFADKPGQLLEVCWETGTTWQDVFGFLDADPAQARARTPHINESGAWRGTAVRRHINFLHSLICAPGQAGDIVRCYRKS